MKKNLVRAIIVVAVILVVYHLLAFMIPFAKTAPFWVSYGFSLAGFCVVGAAFYIAFGKDPSAKSRFYGFPIARIGVIYGVVQLILGFVCMATAFILPWWIAVVLQAIVFGAGVIGLISADVVVEEINIQDEKLKKDVSLMRSLQSKLSLLDSQCEDASAAKAVKALAEELRFSDPVSSDAIAEIETELKAIVDELQQAVVDGDSEATKQLCRKAIVVLNERNRLCKLNK